MPKNRDKFKRAALTARKEKSLEPKNAYGINDPTPKEAVGGMIRREEAVRRIMRRGGLSPWPLSP